MDFESGSTVALTEKAEDLKFRSRPPQDSQSCGNMLASHHAALLVAGAELLCSILLVAAYVLNLIHLTTTRDELVQPGLIIGFSVVIFALVVWLQCIALMIHGIKWRRASFLLPNLVFHVIVAAFIGGWIVTTVIFAVQNSGSVPISAFMFSIGIQVGLFLITTWFALIIQNCRKFLASSSRPTVY